MAARTSRVTKVTFDGVLIATTAALAVISIALIVAPSPVRVVAPALDLAMDTFALTIGALIAVLAWIRYRERHQEFALFQSSAFQVLAMANFLAVITTVVFRSDSTLVATEPGDDLLYVFTAARLMAGGLLVVGGVRTLQGKITRRSILAVTIPAGIFVAVVAFVIIGHPMPSLIEFPSGGGAPHMSTFGSALQVGAGLLLGWAALLARQLWRRDGVVADRYIALALVFAAFAQLEAAIFPGTHPGPVSAADVLRLFFYVILLLAIEAEARSVLSSLHRANETLREMRAYEVERAAIEERARLSRELHDGLAQALWLAKLKVVRLLAQPGLNRETRALARETAAAVELGLSEARQAVLAMHTSAKTDSAFCELLERYVNDYADRFAIPVEFASDGDVPPLGARTQAELLRIAQEALTNIHHHANASAVSVRVGVVADQVAMSITDNGRGFEVEEVSDRSFGLAAMRERASLIGGRLTVTSSPGQGSEISISAPLQRSAAGA